MPPDTTRNITPNTMPATATDATLARLVHLMQLCDSALPVGGFSFSNGLESAVHAGLVHDWQTLEAYTRAVAHASATSDGIVALAAHRAHLDGDFGGVLAADGAATLCRMNAEARTMSARMGRKLAEIVQRISPDPMVERWLAAVDGGTVAGNLAVAQGLAFAGCGIDRRSLFAAQHYGVVQTVLNAALRLVRVSHFATQAILFRAAADTDALYLQIEPLGLDDISMFAPECDLCASLHEKGNQRMFMS